MKVKKYVVDSMPDAMKKIREDLGNQAVILNTKRVKTGGFLGLFGKNQIEVIAAIDPSIRKANPAPEQQGGRCVSVGNGTETSKDGGTTAVGTQRCLPLADEKSSGDPGFGFREQRCDCPRDPGYETIYGQNHVAAGGKSLSEGVGKVDVALKGSGV